MFTFFQSKEQQVLNTLCKSLELLSANNAAHFCEVSENIKATRNAIVFLSGQSTKAIAEFQQRQQDADKLYFETLAAIQKNARLQAQMDREIEQKEKQLAELEILLSQSNKD